MNKTVSVNISGFVFNIEEYAYDKLGKYLDTIRGYFKESDGRDEIMTDIESRIAELFQQKLSVSKQVINMVDVDEVIEVMGQPEAYLDDEAAAENEPSDGGASTQTKQGHTKRIYRDKDENFLGGVCAGLAHYFGWDPLWPRIVFIVMFFGFGTGFLIYLILWMIIPAARTTNEKLEMKGEKVNVDNIGKTVKDKMNDFGEGVRPATEKVKGAVNQVAEQAGEKLPGVFNVVAKVGAVFMIFIGACFTFLLISFLIGSEAIISISDTGIHSASASSFFEIVFSNSVQSGLAYTGITFILSTIIIALFYHGIRILINVKQRIKGVGLGLLILGITGIVLCASSGYQLGKDFYNKNVVKEIVTIEQPQGDTLFLNLMDDRLYNASYNSEIQLHSQEDFEGYHHDGYPILEINKDNIHLGYPELDIRRSETDKFQVILYKESRGPSARSAYNKAENIRYNIDQKDSLLVFSSYYTIKKKDKLRAQDVQIIVKVPEGKSVYLSPRMRHIIYDVRNSQDMYDGDMVGKTWTMINGELSHSKRVIVLNKDPKDLVKNTFPEASYHRVYAYRSENTANAISLPFPGINKATELSQEQTLKLMTIVKAGSGKASTDTVCAPKYAFYFYDTEKKQVVGQMELSSDCEIISTTPNTPSTNGQKMHNALINFITNDLQLATS
jgi:phage shock protein PspC (stress-responsive transcriptional regulator)